MLKIIQHQKLQDQVSYPGILVQVYFLAITGLIVSVFFISGQLRFGDLFFNYFRLREVGLDLLHGQFPQFNFFTGTLLGGATNTFYPWLTAVPLLPLMHFFSPLTWWAFIIGFGFMMGFEIAYFTSQTINWSRHEAFIFANFYVLSLITIDYVYFGNDIGSFYSMLLAPLVFFGWWHWLNQDRWHMMLIGLLLICFTHLVTVIVLGIMLSLLTLVFIDRLRWNKLISLGRAILFFLGITTILWLPILILLKSNQIYTPSEFSMPWLQRPLFIKPLSAYLNFYSDNSFSVVDVLAVILLLISWRHVSSVTKRFTGVALVFLLMNCQPVAKWLVNNTWFSNFQFMHRFSFCSHLLLTIVLVSMIHQLSKWQNVRFIHGLAYFMSGFMILIIILAGRLYITENQQKPVDHITDVKMARPVMRKGGSSVVNVQDLNRPIFWHVLMNTYPDYYPRAGVHVTKLNDVIAPHIEMPLLDRTGYTRSGQLVETVKHSGTYTLPEVAYHQQRYRLLVNGKDQKLHTTRQYVRATLRPGRNVIRLQTPIMWYRYLAMIVSLLSLIILGYSIGKLRIHETR